MIGPSTFVLVSSRFCQLLENACHKHHLIEVFGVNMHVWFLETNALLLQHVVETKINAKITRKKWLNKAFTTQKPHRNHLEPIEQSTDQPVLKVLHNVAHAGLEIPSTSPIAPSQLLGCLLRGQRPSIDAVCPSSSAAAKQSRCALSDAMNKSKTLFTFRVYTWYTQHFRLGFATGCCYIAPCPLWSSANQGVIIWFCHQ